MEQIVDLGEQAVFILMAIASVLALAVGFERAFIFARGGGRADSILREIISKLRENDVSSLKELQTKSPKSIYARFASFSAEHYEKGPESLSELMAGRVVAEKIELEKRLPILSTLGNNAPFLGLLGTVLGVIKAFNGLGALGNSGAEVVMKSISTALLATAAGLFVAIPVVMTNNFFSKKLKVISQNLEIISREFLAACNTKKV